MGGCEREPGPSFAGVYSRRGGERGRTADGVVVGRVPLAFVGPEEGLVASRAHECDPRAAANREDAVILEQHGRRRGDLPRELHVRGAGRHLLVL